MYISVSNSALWDLHVEWKKNWLIWMHTFIQVNFIHNNCCKTLISTIILSSCYISVSSNEDASLSLLFSSPPVGRASRRCRPSWIRPRPVWTSQPMSWSIPPGAPRRSSPGPPASSEGTSTTSLKLASTWLGHPRWADVWTTRSLGSWWVRHRYITSRLTVCAHRLGGVWDNANREGSIVKMRNR